MMFQSLLTEGDIIDLVARFTFRVQLGNCAIVPLLDSGLMDISESLAINSQSLAAGRLPTTAMAPAKRRAW
jgi:hypothetical protein